MATKAQREKAQAKVDNTLEQITQQVIEAIENDPGNWTKPWADSNIGLPVNASTKKRYSGGNMFWLTLVGQARGYSTNVWATYKQWASVGGQVRRGESSTVGLFYKQIVITEEDDSGEKKTKRIPILRSFLLFNADQVEGGADIVRKRFEVEDPEEVEPIDAAEEFFSTVGADLRFGGDRAFYRHANEFGDGDFIQLPERDYFRSAEDFYATMGHEHVHWTGAEHRLSRTKGKHFGDEVYAREELVAELGSAILNAYLGISGPTTCGHAPYIASWLKVLKEQPKALWSVLGDASKAVDFLIHEAGQNGETLHTEDEEVAA